MPLSCQTLALCSKAWSDTTYLDEIKGAFREKLTDDMKRSANEMGVAYSEKVPPPHPSAVGTAAIFCKCCSYSYSFQPCVCFLLQSTLLTSSTTMETHSGLKCLSAPAVH